jgi:hypothetical protein
MSTFRNPVGPQPNKVYWRRRLVVGLGLLAVILVVVLIVVRPGAGAPKPAVTPGSTDTPAPTGSPSGVVAACKPADITVKPVTDADGYGSSQTPMLSMTLTNRGTKACSMKVGSDVQVYTITSGSDLIWNSADCQTAPVPLVKTLEPGTPISFPAFAWDRTRSDKTTCTAKRDKVAAGGASYHLNVSVDSVKSASSKQFVLK